MSELYRAIAGSPITYLAADISANQTTISIVDDSALPDAPNICTIGYGENIETIRYGAKSNGVLQNVTRGLEGTPRAWKAGTEVARFYTAYEHNAIVETIKSHLADYESLVKGGETYEAVLQNGWTGSLRYSKNDLGLVWLRGYIAPGELTEDTIVATMPADYAPLSHSVPIPLFRSGRPRRGVVGFFLSSVSNQIITLSEMAEIFREGQNMYINILYQSVGKEV